MVRGGGTGRTVDISEAAEDGVGGCESQNWTVRPLRDGMPTLGTKGSLGNRTHALLYILRKPESFQIAGVMSASKTPMPVHSITIAVLNRLSVIKKSTKSLKP